MYAPKTGKDTGKIVGPNGSISVQNGGVKQLVLDIGSEAPRVGPHPGSEK